jgi:diguanylate cyclase (GGDEF)-like protein
MISAPITYAGHQTSVGASIGIGLFPDHADDAQSLRRAADTAMYKVKRAGKNRFAFAEPVAS